jgi:hypothetical protein
MERPFLRNWLLAEKFSKGSFRNYSGATDTKAVTFYVDRGWIYTVGPAELVRSFATPDETVTTSSLKVFL